MEEQGVPLSEDEQRILQQIEQQFQAEDPEFARQVSSTSLYRHAGRNLKWAALGFVAGIAFLIVTLSTSAILAFVGFLMMMGSAFWFERNLRKMGRAGWQQLSSQARNVGVKDKFGSAGQRMRDRFKKDE
jgi:hypothetical protein